ncbi:glycosyltransferase [Bacillaceae bacterium W0354]
MKKKILFFLYRLAGGGAERTILNIIKNLDEEEFEIILVLSSSKNNDYIELLPSNVKVRYLNEDRLRYSFLRLSKCIKEENPDLLFSTVNENNIILLIAKILSFKNIPAIVRESSNRTQAGKATRLNKKVTRFLYNQFADRIISLSQGVCDDLINNFGINKSKVNIIYNPIDIENINKLGSEEVYDLDINTGEKLIIAVGRLVEAKDFFTLIKAFHLVSSEVNAKLLILGKGPKETELIALCKKLKVENKVVFGGFKQNPYKYIKKADLFVLSSKWEGFGHVIVEAMASGTPVIATDCNSGPREIIGNDQYGVLVPVSDYEEIAMKLVFLLKDEDSREYYRKKGIERAYRFEASKITKEYSRVMCEVIENRIR